MKILIDMNLSIEWVQTLVAAGFEAVHWSQIGDPRAPDPVILRYAAEQKYVVFTHDLDFSALLAASGEATPSVLQVRSQNLLPEDLSQRVIQALRQFGDELASGAIVSVDLMRMRARLLPIGDDPLGRGN